jgi:diacylglycerol kinase (ATP)
MSRARLILNPASGADQALAHAQSINERLRGRFGPIEVVLTTGAGDAEAAARRAVDDGCDVLFAGGGDGTLNEVVNGAAAAPGGLARVTFGVIPLGTGNDFAQALDIPLAVDDAVNCILEGRRLSVDVGVLNRRLFVNVSGGGFIAEVSDAVTPQLKSIAGRLAYLLGGAQTLLDFEPVGAVFESGPEGERIETPIYAFAACNARMIGGGRLIAPHASIVDGLLDFCLIEGMPALEFVALLRRVSDGGHVGDPRVHYVRAAGATLAFDRELLVNTDGEVLGASRCEYSILPGAATFLAGPGATSPATRS